jgi:hypothetical protein
MKKNGLLMLVTVLGLAGILSACGAGGSTPVATRDVTGLLAGNISNVSAVKMVRLGDGATFSTQVSGTTSASFTLSLPVNSTYQVDLVGQNGATAATLSFPASVASTGSATTKYFTVTNNKVGASAAPATRATTTPAPAINLGKIDVPDTVGSDTNSTGTATGTGTGTSTGASTGSTTLTSSLNPLDQNDEDGNGIPDSKDSKYRLLAVATGTGTDTTTGTNTNDGFVPPAGTVAIIDKGDNKGDKGGSATGGTGSSTTDGVNVTGPGTTGGGETGGTGTGEHSGTTGTSTDHNSGSDH